MSLLCFLETEVFWVSEGIGDWFWRERSLTWVWAFVSFVGFGGYVLEEYGWWWNEGGGGEFGRFDPEGCCGAEHDECACRVELRGKGIPK